MPQIPADLLSQHKDEGSKEEELLSFIKSDSYKNATQPNADIVIVLLATEDSKTNIWKNPNQFQDDYKSLIKSIKEDFN